ncbi:unnamed protein product [Closterium sp. NIES-65]|nr:unnamed protein product [Closterium sp. NIES-65]
MPGFTLRPQSLDNGCAQQGKRSRVQSALWPRVGSESALPDGMLLGFSKGEDGYRTGEPGYSTGEPGYITGEPGYSAPHATVEPISQRYALPAPLPSQVTALGGSLPGAVSRCMCGMVPDEKHRNIQTPVLPAASCHRAACCSLAPHTPVSPPCLPGPAVPLPVPHVSCTVAPCAPPPHVPVGRGLQGRELAASLSEPALQEWRREQDRTGEGGDQLQRGMSLKPQAVETMLHSSEAIDGSASPSLNAWSREEDAVLLRHVLQCGTKQWGELERSGQLKRSNKSCCNRYIFLRRKFLHRFQHQFWSEFFPRGAAPPSHISVRSLALQQQQQQGGVGSHRLRTAVLNFGGLSLDECKRVFLSPNDSHSPAEPVTTLGAVAASPPASPPSAAAAAANDYATLPGAASGFDVASIPFVAALYDAATLPIAATLNTVAATSDANTLPTATADVACEPALAVVDVACNLAALSTAAVASAAVSNATAAFCKLMRETSLCTHPAEVVREEPLCTDPAEVVREEPLCTDPAEVVREETLCTLCTNPAEVVRGARCRGRANVMRGVLCCSDPAAPSLPNKRPRDGFTGPVAAAPVPGSTMQRPQSLESGCARQGKRSRVHPALWPRVGSESALPDDVLLGGAAGTRAGSLPVRASAAGVVSKFEPPGLSLAACPTKRTAALYGTNSSLASHGRVCWITGRRKAVWLPLSAVTRSPSPSPGLIVVERRPEHGSMAERREPHGAAAAGAGAGEWEQAPGEAEREGGDARGKEQSSPFDHYRLAVPPNLSPFASPPPASQAPHFASQAATFSAAATAASTSQLPFARDAYLVVAAASNATSLRRPMKRPRDDCAGLGGDQPLLGGRESPLMRGGVMRGGMERGGMACRGVVCSTQSRRQSVAEQFQQQGESSRAHAADEALLEALLQEGLRQQQQQGGARSRVQRVLWPHVGSESALPDDVLLGFSSEDAALTKRAALSAPPPIHPRAVLPAPMPSELAAPPSSALCFQNPVACCGDFAPCFGDFSLQPVDWPPAEGFHAQPCCSNPSPLVVLYRLSANPMLLPCPDVAFTPRVDGGAPCATDGHRLSRSAWMGVTD